MHYPKRLEEGLYNIEDYDDCKFTVYVNGRYIIPVNHQGFGTLQKDIKTKSYRFTRDTLNDLLDNHTFKKITQPETIHSIIHDIIVMDILTWLESKHEKRMLKMLILDHITGVNQYPE